MSNRQNPQTADVEVDVRSLFRSVLRALPYIVVFVAIIGAGTFYLLSRIPPSYKSEVTILIETGESDLTRTAANSPAETAAVLDQEAIASQVQLIRSRDLARKVVAKLDFASRPEYDPAANTSFLTDILVNFGLARNPADSSSEERILTKYYDNLEVYAIEKSRVIAIDFSSTDPKFAADAANTIAAEYIALQREAKRDTTTDATKWLEGEIADLSTKVTDAEAQVESFRAEHDLFNAGGQTPTTLNEQQLAESNAELGRVRAAKAEADVKAAQIRAALDSGAVPNITDVLNSQLIQRLVEQQVALRSEIAELSATFLPGHPRMGELRAQIADLDAQIAREARKIVDALEGEAQLSLAREQEIQKSLGALKVTAATANDSQVQLRALEREASAQRDLLDTYLRRYREALARQNADLLPADARVISRAAAAITPDFPKKIPMTMAATVAALILSIAFVLIRELASGRPMRQVSFEPLPILPEPLRVGGRVRWADDHGVRRMMPSEPTLAPAIASEVERSLATIAGQIVLEGKRRILVTLAEGSDGDGRPLAAVALARALAKADRRVVLVDLRGDGANSATMGEGADLPGFTDLAAGDASFAQVIFRDRRSRAHFIPAGRLPVSAGTLTAERLATILSALDHTYDHVIVDASDDMIAALGSAAEAAIVVTEFGSGDPRTLRAFDRISAASSAAILLLVVDPAPRAEQEPAGEAA
jgi:succinoglycan biosynthesis transport protein ExoP